MRRRRRRWFDGEGSTEQRRRWLEKQRRESEERRLAYNATKEVQRSHAEAFTVPTRCPDGHTHDWKQTEARRRCNSIGEHCSSKLPNCHSPNFTNYSQIFITTQKSPKTKVVQNQKLYNFAFETIQNSAYILKWTFEFKAGIFKEFRLFK